MTDDPAAPAPRPTAPVLAAPRAREVAEVAEPAPHDDAAIDQWLPPGGPVGVALVDVPPAVRAALADALGPEATWRDGSSETGWPADAELILAAVAALPAVGRGDRPVLALTAATVEARAAALAAGADDCLVLPVVAAEARARIDAMVRARRLRAQARRLAALLELAPEGIALTDAEHTVRAANQAQCAFVRASRTQLVGTDAHAWVVPEDRPSIARRSGELRARRGGTDQRRLRVRATDGTSLDLEVFSQFFPDGTCVAFSRDVTVSGRTETALRAAEATARAEAAWSRRLERELRALADAGAALASLDPEAPLQRVAQIATEALAERAYLLLADPGGELTCAAGAARDADQQPRAQLLTRSGIWRRPATLLRRALEARRTVVGDLAVEPSPDAPRDGAPPHALDDLPPHHGLATPMSHQGRVLGVLLLLTTERRFDEGDAWLAEGLAERCAAFLHVVRTHQSLRRAVAARDELLGAVAHDLRNPLATLLLQVARFRAEPTSALAAARALAADVERIALRLNRQVDELMDVARLDVGGLVTRRRRCTLDRVLQEAHAGQAPLAAAAGLALTLELDEPLPAVLGDELRIHQVVENLVSNAINATAAGTIALRARATADEVRVSVSDTGRGIAPPDLPRVFERGWRGAGSAGTGLGLAIAAGIVAEHRGRIGVDSAPGEGTTFWFTLPVAEAALPRRTPPAMASVAEPPATPAPPREATASSASAASAHAREPAGAAAPPTVVLAEDDPELRAALAAVLTRRGYEVRLAANGAEALARLRELPAAACAVVDLAMPRLDGWELLRRRAADPALAAIPVIVVSGHREAAVELAARGARPLTKPVTAADLLDAVEAVRRR